MSTTNYPPLENAWITDLRLTPGSLEIWLENVRPGGGVLAGVLKFAGLRGVSSREPRAADDEYPLFPGILIQRALWSDGLLELDCHRGEGPGESREPHYKIEFSNLVNELRPSTARTLRAWTGLYPTAKDIDPPRFGHSRPYYSPAQLNAGALGGPRAA